MIQPVYEWIRKRPGGQNMLFLMKDGKKIGGTKEVWYQKLCVCGSWDMWNCNCDAIKFRGFVGGGKIGTFPTQTAAKIGVEQHLGVSTKKAKKKPEPKIVDQKGIVDPVLKKKKEEQAKWESFYHPPKYHKNRKKKH